MENETNVIEIKQKSMYIPICITQAVCIAVILIAVIIIKLFFNNTFLKFEKWCNENLFAQTKITANFDEESTSEI